MLRAVSLRNLWRSSEADLSSSNPDLSLRGTMTSLEEEDREAEASRWLRRAVSVAEVAAKAEEEEFRTRSSSDGQERRERRRQRLQAEEKGEEKVKNEKKSKEKKKNREDSEKNAGAKKTRTRKRSATLPRNTRIADLPLTSEKLPSSPRLYQRQSSTGPHHQGTFDGKATSLDSHVEWNRWPLRREEALKRSPVKAACASPPPLPPVGQQEGGERGEELSVGFSSPCARRRRHHLQHLHHRRLHRRDALTASTDDERALRKFR